MFKKKPQIKNLSPLKSSERRRVADQIIRAYELSGLTHPADHEGQDAQSNLQTQTLTAIRNSLLPENTSSAKFTTTQGANLTPVSGTIYVGTHPGQDERILWFQIGKDETMIPTVYTLWHNPDMLALLYTADVVLRKLQGGADLFAPGLIQIPRGHDPRAVKAAIVAVASHKSETVPRWVGRATIDITALPAGASGTAAQGLHWEGDELWSWSADARGGVPSSDNLAGWPAMVHPSPISRLDSALDSLNEDEDEDEQEDGGVTLAESKNSTNSDDDVAAEHTPSTQEVDDAFIQAFLYAVHDAKKAVPLEPHGLSFPIQPSSLISNMIQPYLHHQTSHYNIKKTSWKNTKKFIKHLDKSLLVKSKDRNGGETVILDIDFNDHAIKNFQPYKLPKSKVLAVDAAAAEGQAGLDKDQSLNQKLVLQTLYRVSSKLVPDLLPSKTSFYAAHQITQALKQYIDSRPELVDENRKRSVRLDPFLANNVLGSNPSAEDSKVLAAGAIARDALNKRILLDNNLCIPYHILLRNGQTYDPESPDASLKPKAGPAPHVTMTIEKRGGNKVVTALAGLEHFFINPQVIRPELQKKCAGSASVNQHIGGKPGMLEIQVQGDQRSVIEKEILGRRGIKSEWIDVVDKTTKKAKR